MTKLELKSLIKEAIGDLKVLQKLIDKGLSVVIYVQHDESGDTGNLIAQFAYKGKMLGTHNIRDAIKMYPELKNIAGYKEFIIGEFAVTKTNLDFAKRRDRPDAFGNKSFSNFDDQVKYLTGKIRSTLGSNIPIQVIATPEGKNRPIKDTSTL